MRSKIVRIPEKRPSPRAERGIGLLLAFVVLILAAGYVLTSFLSPTSIKLAQDRQYTEILNRAREVLIASSVSAAGASERPGDMRRPDVVADTGPTKNYNGDSETGCFDRTKVNALPLIVDNANARCLGRLPWRSFGMSNEGISENDPTGIAPWYAVSGNLAFQACLNYLNSDLLDFSYVGFRCPAAGTSLPFPWLTIRDATGAVLSNRVAFVIIVPGRANNGQSRPPPPNLAAPNQYLDAVTVTVTSVTPDCATPPCNLTYSNADLDDDFIQGDASQTFNDRLIYVTIDELMAKIEDRAGKEIRAGIQRFRDTYGAPNGTYPWLAPFADPTIDDPNGISNYKAVVGTRVGLVPFYKVGQRFDTEFSWQITGGTFSGTPVMQALVKNGMIMTNGKCLWTNLRGVNCFGDIANPVPGVARRRVEIEYPTSWTNTTITATQASATSHTIRQVLRNGSLASCLTTTLVGCVVVSDYDVAGNLLSTGKLLSGTGTLQTSRIRLYPEFPAWVLDNHWHQFAVAAMGLGWIPGGSACPCLTIKLDGNLERSDVKLVVITAGKKLSGQTRPSAMPSDYFDSTNNRNLTTGQTFDRQSVLTNTFNDRLYY